MTHNIPRPVYTYLCHNHFNSLPGIAVHDEVDSGKCVVCGHKAEVAVRSASIFGEVLNRIVVLYFNEVQRKYELQNGEWEFDEDELGEHFCGQCHFPLTIVRPGKYQCETPWCPSNQKEATNGN